MSRAIFEKITHTFGTMDSQSYSISVGGVTIYTGTSYKAPDASSNTIVLNDIIAPYLYNTFPTSVGTGYESDAYKTRSFVVTAGSTTTTYIVRNDYDESYDNDEPLIPATCGKRLGAGALAVFTYDGTIGSMSSVVATIKYKSGATSSVTMLSSSGAVGTCKLNLANYSNVASVVVNGNEFKVDDCYEGILYFVNAMGGWEQLVLKRVDRTDTITREVYTASSGRKNTRNYVARNWALTTGLLKDTERNQIWNAVETTNAVLYLPTGGFIPVIVTDSESAQTDGTRGKFGSVVINVTEKKEYER